MKYKILFSIALSLLVQQNSHSMEKLFDKFIGCCLGMGNHKSGGERLTQTELKEMSQRIQTHKESEKPPIKQLKTKKSQNN